MANKFKRAGAGNWSADASWSTTSGGIADTVVPTSADDVFLDANSGDLTIDSASICRSLDCTGYTGTLLHNAFTLSISGASSTPLKFVAGMTYTLASATSSAISYTSTTTNQQTVDYAGKTTGNVVYNSSGTPNGSWIYANNHVMGATATLTHTRGTLDFNGKTLTGGFYSSNNSNTRTLTLGASAITLAGASSIAWDTTTTTGLTVTANTATVTLTGSAGGFTTNGTFDFNGLTVVITGASTTTIGAATGIGSLTFATLTKTGTATTSSILQLACDLTVTGTFTANGSNSNTNRLIVQSNSGGTARTITAGTVTVTNCDFMDITGAGAGSWDLSAITGLSGDCGGNSGITFTTPASQTWSGTSGGNWSANAWTTRVPLPQDDVTISSAFSGGQTITVNVPRLGKAVDFTGTTGTPTFTAGGGVTLFGSLTLIAGMTFNATSNFIFGGRGTCTITSAGKTYPGAVRVGCGGGSYTLQDTMTVTSNWTLDSGTFNANDQNVTASTFTISGSVARALTMGAGTWTTTSTSTATVWNAVTQTNLTLSASSATIAITGTSANLRTFSGGNATYGILNYTIAGSTGGLDVVGNNSFAKIRFSDASNARTIRFTAGNITTIRDVDGFDGVIGTAGKLMSIDSITASTHTLTHVTGVVATDYVSIKNSIATGGTGWYAGSNSTNVSGNTGWTFTDVPPSTPLRVRAPVTGRTAVTGRTTAKQATPAIMGVTANQPNPSWFEFNATTHEAISARFLKGITEFPRIRCIAEVTSVTAQAAARLWVQDVRRYSPSTYILYGAANTQSVYLPTYYDTFLPIVQGHLEWAVENGMNAFQIGNEWEISAQSASLSITSLTRATNVTTAVCATAHGLATGDTVIISGASPSSFNVTTTVTVTDATTYTYANAGVDESATGTLTHKIGEPTFCRLSKQFAVDLRALVDVGDVKLTVAVSQGHISGWVATTITPGVDLDYVGLDEYGASNSYSAFTDEIDQMYTVYGDTLIMSEFNVNTPWTTASIDGVTPATRGFDARYAEEMYRRFKYIEAKGITQAYVFTAWNSSEAQNNMWTIFYNTGTTTGNFGVQMGDYKAVYDVLLGNRQSHLFLGTQEKV